MNNFIAKYYNIVENINHAHFYNDFYLYSIIAHSTAIEGSTLGEDEVAELCKASIKQGDKIEHNHLEEDLMNIDLKHAYDFCMPSKEKMSIPHLQDISSYIMANTGEIVTDPLTGMSFSSTNGDIRLCDVQAGSQRFIPHQQVLKELSLYCEWYNKGHLVIKKDDIESLYKNSFEAHYRHVMIHPFVDGNGRLSRLVMNKKQFDFSLLPSIVYKEDKNKYIKGLVNTTKHNDLNYFYDFMFSQQVKFFDFVLEKEKIAI